MEIGSISGMQQGMAVGQMRPPPPPEDSEEAPGKMSSLIMEQQDAFFRESQETASGAIDQLLLENLGMTT